MAGSRIQKLNELFRREVSQIFLKEVDFEDALVTITDVKVSSDLKYAKIKITVLPDKREPNVMRILQKNIYHIQQTINRRLFMRPIPKISFEVDQVQSRAQQVEKLLGDIKNKANVEKKK